MNSHPEYEESPCSICGQQDLHLTNDCEGMQRQGRRCAFVEARDGQTVRCGEVATWDVVYDGLFRRFYKPTYLPSAEDPREPGGAWCLRHAVRLALALNLRERTTAQRGLRRLLKEVRVA